MRPTPLSTRVPALLGVTALLTASLAGCALIPGYGACTPDLTSGDASSIVTATGSTPDIDFPTPLIVTGDPQVSVIDAGEGDAIPSGSQVAFDFTVEYGNAGQEAGSSNGQIESGLEGNSVSQALTCAHVGDRIALVTTAEAAGDGFGPGALDSIDPKQTLVAVLDVTASYLGKANGLNQLPLDGMPTVVTQVDGKPGITVPAEAPPATTRSSAIKAGDGAQIDAGDDVVMHLSIWTWPATTGDEPVKIQSTWDDRIAGVLKMASYDDDGGLPAGFVDAVVGQRVGGQVLLVLAPGDDGFDPAQLPAGITEDSTTIFVIDLLGIAE